MYRFLLMLFYYICIFLKYAEFHFFVITNCFSISYSNYDIIFETLIFEFIFIFFKIHHDLITFC